MPIAAGFSGATPAAPYPMPGGLSGWAAAVPAFRTPAIVSAATNSEAAPRQAVLLSAAVDLFMIDHGHTIANGIFFNKAAQDISVFFRNLLGIIQQWMKKVLR